jgi:signal transduction histidine kinase
MRCLTEQDMESRRLSRLHSLALLDTEPEAFLDSFTELAARLTDMPIALISLIDSDRQWLKSAIGLPRGTQTPRDISFCQYAIKGDDFFEVEDASLDPRFADNPLVCSDPHIAHYAGSPLVMPGGERIGTLCVMGHTPGRLNLRARDLLLALSRGIVSVLLLREREHDLGARVRAERALQDEGVGASVLEILQAEAIALRFCCNDESAAFEVLINTTAGTTPAAAACLAASAQTLTGIMTESAVQRLFPDESAPEAVRACHAEGIRCLIYVPVRKQQRLLAEIVLYFRNVVELDDARKALIDVITRHLAIRLENQQVRARDRESAVTTERQLIARELHDSIAQSLGFLKIQIHLMRKAIDKNDHDLASFVLAELDSGLASSIADVRELLLHFRTRTNSGEIETAIQETLQKFHNQSGLKAYFESSGFSPELATDVQIQVLNVLQEALSNARKHSQASRVDVKLVKGQTWQLSVRDNGKGFDTNFNESIFHVGLDIMQERADLIGAKLLVESAEGSGTTVTLRLPLRSTLDSLISAAATADVPVSSAVTRLTNDSQYSRRIKYE